MSTKPTNPLAIAAAEANAKVVDAALAFERTAEALEEDFRASAQAFSAARAAKVSVAALAKAVKDRAGESSISLHGVEFFTSNAAVVAHAFVGDALALPGDLDDGISARDLQTLALQTYNKQGGNKVLAEALKRDDTQAVYDYLKAANKAPKAEKGIAALLKAAEGVVAKAEALAEAGEEVDTEALVSLAHLLKSLLVIDASVDHQQVADEAADLAELMS